MHALSLHSYIKKLLKQVDVGHGIRKDVVEEVNAINIIVLKAIMKRANLLAQKEDRKTIKEGDVKFAAKMLFAGEWEETIAMRAINRYNASLAPPYEAGKTREVRAGITFPVARIEKLMRKLSAVQRIGVMAPVYMAAILEEMTRFVLHLSKTAAEADKKKYITIKHLHKAVVEEGTYLPDLLEGVVMSNGVITRKVTAMQ